MVWWKIVPVWWSHKFFRSGMRNQIYSAVTPQKSFLSANDWFRYLGSFIAVLFSLCMEQLEWINDGFFFPTRIHTYQIDVMLLYNRRTNHTWQADSGRHIFPLRPQSLLLTICVVLICNLLAICLLTTNYYLLLLTTLLSCFLRKEHYEWLRTWPIPAKV